METAAEVKVDQAAKHSDMTLKTCSADVREAARMTLAKNIMFPSLSDDMLLKIVDIRCHDDASKQFR